MIRCPVCGGEVEFMTVLDKNSNYNESGNKMLKGASDIYDATCNCKECKLSACVLKIAEEKMAKAHALAKFLALANAVKILNEEKENK